MVARAFLVAVVVGIGLGHLYDPRLFRASMVSSRKAKALNFGPPWMLPVMVVLNIFLSMASQFA